MASDLIAEYIWLDAGMDFRSKTRVIRGGGGGSVPLPPPPWSYDGSSTGQASVENSEVMLKPVYCCPDPFRRIENHTCVLVLCDTWIDDTTPHPTNTRVAASYVFDRYSDHKPLFGLEQEFFLICPGAVRNQPHFYCAPNTDTGRACVEEVFGLCIRAGLALTGMNAEVAPWQWEYQVCDYGIRAADQLCVLRYILTTVAEKHGYDVDSRPKPFPDVNGSGCHINFSTETMRELDSEAFVAECVAKLASDHDAHIIAYGAANMIRLSGTNETSCSNTFTSGKGDRTASVRIPNDTFTYIEDRRPGADVDPYTATALILETVCDSNSA